jgi:hypothetical protein
MEGMRYLTRMKTSTALGWSARDISASKTALRCSVCRMLFFRTGISGAGLSEWGRMPTDGMRITELIKNYSN